MPIQYMASLLVNSIKIDLRHNYSLKTSIDIIIYI